MRNIRTEQGFKTTDINIAAMLLCMEGAEFGGTEGDNDQKLFFIKGNPEELEKRKNAWFRGNEKILGDLKAFAEKRRSLLKLLPR